MNKKEFKNLLSMDKKELINIILKQDTELKEKEQDILYLVSRCVQHGNKIEEQNNKLIDASIEIDNLKEEIKELNHTIKQNNKTIEELKEEIKGHKENLGETIDFYKRISDNDMELTMVKLSTVTNDFMYNILQNSINDMTTNLLKPCIELIENMIDVNEYIDDNSYGYLSKKSINNSDLETLKNMCNLLEGKIEYIDYIEDLEDLEDLEDHEDIENDILNTLFSNIEDTIEDIEDTIWDELDYEDHEELCY